MMKFNSKKIALTAVLVLGMPSIALANNFYISGQVGYSQQINDSKPYGNNIAQDSDFPSSFEADDDIVGAFGLGYKFNDNFRIEGRISNRESSTDDKKIGTGDRDGSEYILNAQTQSMSLTVEAFYDFANSSAFTPYVKAGVGITRNTYEAKLGGAGVAAFDAFDGKADGYYDNYSDDSSTDLTWNVGAGLSYDITQQIALYTEYQYSNFGDVKTGQDSFTDGFKIDDLSTHEVSFGLRYSF